MLMRGGGDEQCFGIDDGVVPFAPNGTQVVLEQIGTLTMGHVDAVDHDIIASACGFLLDHHGDCGRERVTEICDQPVSSDRPHRRAIASGSWLGAGSTPVSCHADGWPGRRTNRTLWRWGVTSVADGEPGQSPRIRAP